MIKKRVVTALVLGAAALSVVAGCWLAYFFVEFPKQTGHHISELTVNAASVYFGAGNCLYQFDTETGALDQLHCERSRTFGKPAVDEERIYARGGQYCTAVDLLTHEVVWRADQSDRYEATYDFHYPGATVLADNTVITAGRKGIQAYEAELGTPRWQTQPGGRLTRYTYTVSDGIVWYLWKRLDQANPASLRGLDAKTGKLYQSIDPQPTARFDELVTVDGQVVIGAMDVIGRQKRIFAASPGQPQRVAWLTDIDSWGQVSSSIVEGDLVIFRSPMDTVHALRMDSGLAAWSFTAGDSGNPCPSAKSKVLVFTLAQFGDGWEDYRLDALDAASGCLVWEHYLGEEGYGVTEPVIVNNSVYIGNRDVLEVLDLETGRVLQRVEVDSTYQFRVSKSGL